MSRRVCVVFSALILLLKLTGAFPQSGHDLAGNRTRRDVHCRDDLEYLNDGICCLNCPAGTHMKSPCTRAGERGKCEECDYGTYTQHGNGLPQCFRCMQCRPDQEVVTPCSHTANTECQCKSGRFCDPDQACEVCKKCSRCEKDEEMVRPCTPTANTVCKKIQPTAPSASGFNWQIGVPIAAIVLLVLIIVAAYIWKCKAADSQRNPSGSLKAGQNYSDCPSEEWGNGESQRPHNSSLTLTLPQRVRAKSTSMEDERMLCESLTSSASNSQHSLAGLPSTALLYPAQPPRANLMVSQQPNWRDDEQFPKLFPLNGEESLKKCFEYFEDLDFSYYKRFFRLLGLTDNVINSKADPQYEDTIHVLLNVWMEKEGREASLNDLLKALLDLNQRRTAENIKEKAVHNGHYCCES